MIFLFLQELLLFALVQLIGIFVVLKGAGLVREETVSFDFSPAEIIFFIIFFFQI